MTDNRQWLINGRPRGRGLLADDFKKVVTEVPECAEGHVLVKNEILGFDPAQKGWMENIGGRCHRFDGGADRQNCRMPDDWHRWR